MVSSGMWVGTSAWPVSRQSTMPAPQRHARGQTGAREQPRSTLSTRPAGT
ncbi:hypothetical protein E2C01_080979 [Portunus trituberculatus]|uniref:Uncharacterized protein n=1 Tax=Portunus trituberculatus TaxID=210409 RepID=A0A5B7IV16_PORTR|nr:hypothetical protein [Portunus trituberculatus]